MDSLSNSGGGAWQYRRAITIDNTGGSELTDYPVKIDYIEGGPVTPAGVWDLDESSGSLAYDSSGNGADGSLYNGAYFTSTGCRYGNCVFFDGINDYISMGDPAALKITGNQTISIWVKPTVLDARRNPLNKAYGGEGTFTLEPAGSMSYYYGQSGANASPYQGFGSGTGTITAGEWNHVVLVRDLSNMKLTFYVNGSQVAQTNAVYSTATAGTQPFLIGNGYTTYYTGLIDEVGVYSSALAPDQVTSLFNGEAPEPVLNGVFTKAKADLSDIRFTDQDTTTEIPFYLDSYTDNSMTAWVNIPSIPANSSKTIYLYYGNISAQSSSDFSALAEITTSGGEVSLNDTSVIHRFTSNGTFTVSGGSITVSALVVAGGGGGGGSMGGGGGAGGLLYSDSLSISPNNYTISVGNGGSGGYSTARGAVGGNSSFSTLTAIGGGGGGYYSGATGLSGGSGGGGGGTSSTVTPTAGGTGTVGQGNNGGISGTSTYRYMAGGGGGAGAIGQSGQTTRGGNGGIGLAYDISGANTYYAGGGGGGGYSSYCSATSVGGTGGGGAGNCTNNGNGSNGIDNTGGGGGGAGYSTGTGGNGGSGVVIISYQFREDSGSSLGTVFAPEEVASSGYLSPGTYTSPDDANVIDLNWIGTGSWSTVNPNFEASVTIPGAEEAIQFEARTGYGEIGSITWSPTWQDLGTATSTGTFTGSNAAWDALDDDTDGHNWRYVQVRATLTSSDGEDTPILSDYTVTYGTDVTDPTNPTSATSHKTSAKTEEITNNSWTNETTPYFEWSGASDEDGGSGIDCYYVYFGLDDTADPETAGLEIGGTKCHLSSNIDLSATDTNPLESATSGQTYYLRIDTRDKAGNITDMPNGQAIFTYKIDNISPISPSAAQKSPVGYTSTNSYSFNWTDYIGSDDYSGISHYQYKTGGEGATWNDVMGTSFTNQALTPITNGQNTLYIRAVDEAGNTSDESADWYRDYFYYSANAPSEPQTLTVDPNSNTTNSFNFSWSKPATYNEGIKGYRYSVNATPTADNTVYLSATGDTVSTGNIPAATNQGINTFYVVAIDTIDNVNYSNYASVQFEANTTAPSAPLSPQAIDSSNRATEDWSITVKWQAPQFGTVDRYYVYRSVDQTNWVKIAETGSNSLGYIDTNLEQAKLYYYKVHALDNAAAMSIASSIVSKAPTGKYTTPPTVVSGPEVEATAVGAIITWSTDRAASSFVEYSTDTSYKQSNGSLTPTTTHRVVLSGLNPSTGYNFRVQSLDEERDYAPSEAYSGNFTFVTSAAPGISEVEVSDIGLASAILTWKTTSAATSTVKYGTSTSYGSEVKNESGSTVTTHTIRLPDLNHSTVYNFKITGTDIDGNYMESDNYVFTTLTYPRISNVRFEQQKDTATSTLKVTWSSNVPLTSVVKFREAEGGATKEASSSKLSINHSMIVSNLKDNTDYIMTTEGRDAYGNLAISDANRVRTDFDTRPPEILNVSTETEIQGFGIEAKGQVIVSWETDEPATSQIEYGIGSSGDYTNRTQEDTSLTTSHVVIISDLKTSSPYHFRIISRDQSENEGMSEDYTALTPQASRGVLDEIINSLYNAIGWLFD
mgnify:CR=1 FL=1